MTEHLYNERFALMWYACDCGHRERIWNSRNGVTPFCLGCPSCGDMKLMHVDWARDETSPSHKLHRGQRYFVDGTSKDAVECVERRIKASADAGKPVPAEAQKALLDEAWHELGQWQKGWPMLKRHERAV